jgi:1-deoxy-D-xylulose-5-phosphate reductoisomerase
MRLPIQYALTYPERVAGPSKTLRATDLTRLDFEAPDHGTFPLLNIAREAGISGSTYPTVLSAADSVAVDAFLEGRISFQGIAAVVRAALDAHVAPSGPLTLDAVADAETWAERVATEWIERRSGSS